MSLSNPRPVNPASKFFEWSGSPKRPGFQFYNKDTQETVYLDATPLYLITLDELSCIKGYDKSDDTGIYSNEVRNLSNEPLNVKNYKGVHIASGFYESIKHKVVASGGKFCKSVYCCLVFKRDGKKQYELVNVQFKGSSLGPWIDARVRVDSGQGIILKPGSELKKNGGTEYYEPIIEKVNATPEDLKVATDMDKSLQDYLDNYLSYQESQILEEDKLTKTDLIDEMTVKPEKKTTEDKIKENDAFIEERRRFNESNKKRLEEDVPFKDSFDDVDDLPF